MLLRIHRSTDNHEVVGICDRELMGKTLKEGEISISINEAFFGNQPVCEEDVIRVLAISDNITIIGKRCIDLAIRQGLLDLDSCLIVEGIPYSTIIRL